MRALLAQAALALFAIAAGLAFAPAFGGRLTAGDIAPTPLLIAVLVASIVPALVVVLARRAGLDAPAAVLAGVVLGGAAIALATRPGRNVLSGPYRLLTSALPATADGTACATIATLVGLASLIAATLADYARLRALAVAPAFICLFAAVALDAGAGEPPAWYAAVPLVLAGASLALIRQPVRTASTSNPTPLARLARRGFPIAGAVAILLAGGLLGTAFATDLPAVEQHAADPRNLVAAPLRPRSAVDPMQQYPAFAQGLDRIDIHGTSSRQLDELPMVTLNGFTGQTWTTTAQFRRAGTTLRLTRGARPVTLDVHAVDTTPLSWLVRPDQPSHIDRSGLGLDQSTGDIVVPRGAAYPTHYRIVGAAPVVASDRLDADRAVGRTGPVVDDGGPAVPAAIAAFAKRVRTENDDYREVLALSVLLRGDDWFVDDSGSDPGGSGYYQILKLLQAPTKHVGTSEQYASAFALMARVLGFRSRLVLGFRPRYANHGDSFSVTGRDVHVWAQVEFTHAGWVTFDPTPTHPSSRRRTRRPPAGSDQSPSGRSRNPVSASAPRPAPSRANAVPQNPGGSSGSSLYVVVAIAALIVVLTLAAPPGLKATRRRRRRGASRPAHAVYGAWRETTDRLAEVGVPPQRGRLTSETAARAPDAVRAQVTSVGRLLDRAGYAPEDAQPRDAREAWQHADAAARTLRGGMSPGRRLLAALDPRPLFRR